MTLGSAKSACREEPPMRGPPRGDAMFRGDPPGGRPPPSYGGPTGGGGGRMDPYGAPPPARDPYPPPRNEPVAPPPYRRVEYDDGPGYQAPGPAYGRHEGGGGYQGPRNPRDPS
eukprot:427686-Prorocentrum_minimum.AAC.1